MPMRIGMLECGITPLEMQHKHGHNLDDFKSLFSAVDPNLSYSDFKAFEGELPSRANSCDAYVITGSADAVYDRPDWMRELQGFLRNAADEKQTLLGICFGHQLLADTFGGEVEKSGKGWGIGVHNYVVNQPMDWMDRDAENKVKTGFSIFATHQDQVITPPPGAQVLAGNAFCPNAMLQINYHILSLQPHPEMSHDYGRDLLQLRRDKIGPAAVDRAIGTLGKENDRHEIAGWLVNFMRG
ncbi:glutamine amidotransferase-related protein [Kiloniella sp.]|uniref:glutamine amidotransferase-related protein n=1 Tax=Kiloniella sp. TaxID=1938587 RepID=UPI003B0211A4